MFFYVNILTKFFFNSEIGSHVKLPRSIKIEKVNEILRNLEVISSIFTEGSIIGFMKCRGDNNCTYMKENPIDSILKKNIKSSQKYLCFLLTKTVSPLKIKKNLDEHDNCER